MLHFITSPSVAYFRLSTLVTQSEYKNFYTLLASYLFLRVLFSIRTTLLLLTCAILSPLVPLDTILRITHDFANVSCEALAKKEASTRTAGCTDVSNHINNDATRFGLFVGQCERVKCPLLLMHYKKCLQLFVATLPEYQA